MTWFFNKDLPLFFSSLSKWELIISIDVFQIWFTFSSQMLSWGCARIFSLTHQVERRKALYLRLSFLLLVCFDESHLTLSPSIRTYFSRQQHAQAWLYSFELHSPLQVQSGRDLTDHYPWEVWWGLFSWLFPSYHSMSTWWCCWASFQRQETSLRL